VDPQEGREWQGKGRERMKGKEERGGERRKRREGREGKGKGISPQPL